MTSEEDKIVQKMLTERPRRRVVYRRPPLTGSQRDAYYGIPNITPSTSRETTTEDKEKEDVAEKEKSNLQESIPAAASAHLNESSFPSYTISKSALAVFDRTKKSTSTTEEEDENVQESIPAAASAHPNESSLLSYTISKSALAVFDRTKKNTSTIEEEDENVQAASDPTNLNESAISSFNISQSALDVFNRTKKNTTTTEDDEEEVNTIEESSLRNNVVKAGASDEALTDLATEPMEVDKSPSTPLKKFAGKRTHPVTPQQPNGSTTLTASRNKENFNLTPASSLQHDSPVTSRVAPKRFAPSAPSEVEPNITSGGKEIILQASSSSKEDIHQSSNNSSPSNLVEKENEACRRSMGINDISLSPVDTEVLKSPIHDDSRDMYDNEAGNFSALSALATDDDGEEEQPQQKQKLDENIQQPSTEKESSTVSIASPGPSPERPVVPPKKPAKKKNVTTAPKKAAVKKNTVTAAASTAAPKKAAVKKNTVTAAASTAAPKKYVKYSMASPATKNNNQKKDLFGSKKPEIVKPITPPSNEPEVRRSKRNRVRVLRSDLGEKLIYEYDEFGMPTLVGVKVVQNDSYIESDDGNAWKSVKKGRKTKRGGRTSTRK